VTERRRPTCRRTFYGAGIVFGLSAGIILIYDLVRVLSGAASEEELVAVRESEEL
jgi:hypothetical protein